MFQFNTIEEEFNQINATEQADRNIEKAAERVTAEHVARLIQAQNLAPNVSKGLAGAYAFTDMTPNQLLAASAQDDGNPRDIQGEVGAELDRPLDEQDEEDGLNWFARGLYEYGIKPIVRGAITIGDTAYREIVQRPLVATGATFLEGPGEFIAGRELTNASGSVAENYGRQGTSAGIEAIKGLFDEDVSASLGTGLIPGGPAFERQLEGSQLQFQGRRANYGQLWATTFLSPVGFHPGEGVYDVGAGISQFGAEVIFDPLALASGGSSKAGSAARGLSKALGASDNLASSIDNALSSGIVGLRRQGKLGGTARRFADRTDDAGNFLTDRANQLAELIDAQGGRITPEIEAELYGLINTGHERSVLAEKLLPWANNENVAQRIADASGPELWRTWNRSGANQLPDEVINQLGKTDDPAAVADILTRQIAGGNLKEPGFYSEFGTWVRKGVDNFRFTSKFRNIGASGMVNAQEKSKAMSMFETLMRTARVAWDESDEAIQELQYTPTGLANDVDDVEDVPRLWLEKFRQFDREPDHALLDDVRTNGFDEPLEITVDGSGNAALTDGNSRLSVAKEMDLDHVPVRVRKIDGDLNVKGGHGPVDAIEELDIDAVIRGDATTPYSTFSDLEEMVTGSPSIEEYTRSQMIQDMLDMKRGDRERFTEIYSKVLSSVGRSLSEVDSSALRAFVRESQSNYRSLLDDLGRYNTTDLGRPANNVFDHKLKVTMPNGTKQEIPLPSPQFLSEAQVLGRYPLPDVDSIRRASHESAVMRALFDNVGWKGAVDLARGFTQKIFKPAVLLRVAYIARTQFDDQLRAAAVGYDNAITNPFRFAMTYMRDPDAAMSLLPDSFLRNNEYARTLAGDAKLVDTFEAQQVLNNDITGVRQVNEATGTRGTSIFGALYKDELVIRPDDAPRINRDAPLGSVDAPTSRSIDEIEDGTYILDDGTKVDQEWVDAHRREIAQIAEDPIGAYLLDNPNDLEGLYDWLRSDEVIPAYTNKTGREVVRAYRRNLGSRVDEIMDDPDLFLQWGNEVIERIDTKFGRSERLRIAASKTKTSEVANLGDDLKGSKDLDRLIAEEVEFAPTAVKAELPHLRNANSKIPLSNKLSQMTDMVSDYIIRQPADYMSRFPTFKQAIADDLEDLMPLMKDDALRREIVEGARENLQLPDQWIKRLEDAADAASGRSGGITDIRQAQDVATRHAVQKVADTLFDVSTRSEFQQQFDAIFPFIDAWREGLSIWGRLAKNNPNVALRGMATFSAASRESGFIYTNEHGDRVFSVPTPPPLLSGIATGGLAGASVGAGVGSLSGLPGAGALVGGAVGGALGGAAGQRVQDTLETGEQGTAVRPEFQARLSGINMLLNSRGPGFGPVVQWPAGMMLGQTTDDRRNFLRDTIIPFGTELDEPEDLADFNAVAREIAPAWSEKIIDAVTKGRWNETQFNNMRAETIAALELTGKYDLSKQTDRNRLERDANRSTQYMMLLRGLIQGTFLTGPSGEWGVNTGGMEPELADVPEWDPETDPDGRWHTIGALANEYRNLLEATNDPDIATQKFMEVYGVEPWYIKQGKTQSIGPQPATARGRSWMQSNPDFVKAYPEVAGYFAPAEEGDEFDYSIYLDLIESGDLELVEPQQQIRLGESAKARQIYYTIKEMLPEEMSRDERRRRLNFLDGLLNEQYPNWRNPVSEFDSSLREDEWIERLQRAVNDENLPESELTQPLRDYFLIRQIALDRVRAATGKDNATLDREEAAGLNKALLEFGSNLAEENPAFESVWFRLKREVEE